MSDPKPTVENEFEKAAAAADQESLLSEFWSFLAHNKKWRLLPIIIVMLFLGTLSFLSGTAVTPFISTLFWRVHSNHESSRAAQEQNPVGAGGTKLNRARVATL